MKSFLSELKTSLALTLILTVLLCGAYPVAVWAAGQALLRERANGSLIVDQDGEVRGSALLAQNFSSARYFQPRPSAAGAGYDATASSGTNLGPTSAKLANGIHATDAVGNRVRDPGNFDGVKDLVAAYRTANDLDASAPVPVPADAVTRSASGLDPHISVANANLQAVRVARARQLPLERVKALVTGHTDGRSWNIFGEAGVNVLLLNRALDRLSAGE